MKNTVFTRKAQALLDGLEPHIQATVLQVALCVGVAGSKSSPKIDRYLTPRQLRAHRKHTAEFRREFKAKYGRYPKYVTPIAPRPAR